MLRRRTAQGAFAIALLVGLLSLPACTSTEADQPRPTTTEKTATTPSDSTTREPDRATPPEQSDAMASADEAGAVAAATYFAQLYAYAWASGDTTTWIRMSSDACEWCARVADDINAMVELGERSTSASIAVEESNGTEIEANRWYSADLHVVQGPSERLAADGTVLSESAGGRFRLFAAMSWSAGSWRVEAVDILDGEP